MSVAIVPIELGDFAKLVARTVEVFGNAERAVAWLETSNPKLGGSTPLRAYQASRVEQIEEELSAIEHGVAA
jgi:uncharacterized protein (DUF2384 family)